MASNNNNKNGKKGGRQDTSRTNTNSSSNASDSIIRSNSSIGNDSRVPGQEGSSRKRSDQRERDSNTSTSSQPQSIPVTESTKKQRTSNGPLHSPTNRDQALTQSVQTPLAAAEQSLEDQNLDDREGDQQIPSFSPIRNDDDSVDSEGNPRRRRSRGRFDSDPDDENFLDQGEYLTGRAAFDAEVIISNYWGDQGPDGSDLPSWPTLCNGDTARAAAIFKARLCDRGTSLRDFLATAGVTSGYYTHDLDNILASNSATALDSIIERCLEQQQTPRNSSRSTDEQNSATRPVFAWSNAQLPILRRPHTSAAVQDYLRDARLAGQRHATWSITDVVDPAGLELLDSELLSKRHVLAAPGYIADWCHKWSLATFHENLALAFSPSNAASSNGRLVEQIGSIDNFFGEIPDRDAAARYRDSVVTHITAARQRGTAINESEIVQKIKSCINSSRTNSGPARLVPRVNQRLHSLLMSQHEPTDTIRDLNAAIAFHIDQGAQDVERALPWLPENALDLMFPHHRRWDGAGDGFVVTRGRATFPYAAQPRQQLNECNGLCFGCGKDYKGPGKRCDTCTDHPDRNMEDIPFTESAAYHTQCTFMDHPEKLRTFHYANGEPITGPAREKIEQGKARRTLENAPKTHHSGATGPPDVQQQQQPYHQQGYQGGGRGRGGGRLGGHSWLTESQQQPYHQQGYQGRGRGRGGGRHGGRAYGNPYRSQYPNNEANRPSNVRETPEEQGEFHQLASLSVSHNNDIIILPPVTLHTSNLRLTLSCLFDTGALQGNYISAGLAAHMEDNGETLIHDGREGLTIVFAGTSHYTSSLGSMFFHVTFLNEVSQKNETIFNLKATILDSQFQLIVGLPLIRQYDITAKIPSFFSAQRKVTDVTLETPAINPPSRPHVVSALTALDSSEAAWVRWRQRAGRHTQSPLARNQLCLLSIIKSKDELLFSCERDIDQVDWPENPFDAEIFFPEESNPIEKITIEGPLHTQIKIRELCKQYEDIFSEHVRSEPASVPPMEIKVNLEEWKVPRNRGPPRLQTNTKMAEIEKQIKKYLELGVIKPIDASEYSNIHMVPKPTPGEWRFCLDFVQLNRCTEGSDGWPIPNIPAMLTRIGNRKSTVFGVMDMTAGYHQAPISAASQLFTAFICCMGIFCWLRVPMGLKNAASYFQRVMATVVLASILYIACELYIDDIFVFGKDDDEFVRNLESVFKRLRLHKVTLNPKKCRFGLPSVEYVGHIITADGVSFSKEKREKVLNFPLPKTQKDLQAFLGLINYFRDHAPQMTELERPLRDLMDTSKRNFNLVWNAHAERSFFGSDCKLS